MHTLRDYSGLGFDRLSTKREDERLYVYHINATVFKGDSGNKTGRCLPGDQYE